MTQKVNYDKKRADALRAMHDARIKAAAKAKKEAAEAATKAQVAATEVDKERPLPPSTETTTVAS